MGMELVSADPEAETLTVAMPMKPELERGMGLGQMHGGPIAALIDTAGCFALVMLLAKGVPTVNFRTDYLRPVMNSGLTAVAKVRRTGRTVGVVDVDVQDDAGRLVAVGRGTFGTSA
jgi:uncharacterized protein (TIGR00369 family)